MLTFKSEWVIQAVEMKERQVCVNECPFFRLKANRYDLLGLQTDRQTDRLSSMSIRITQCVLGKHIFWLRFQNPMESLHVYKCVKSNLNGFIRLLVLVRFKFTFQIYSAKFPELSSVTSGPVHRNASTNQPHKQDLNNNWKCNIYFIWPCHVCP